MTADSRDSRRPMHDKPEITDRILQRIGDEFAALSTSTDGLVTCTVRAPGILFHGLPRVGGDWFYWSRPSQDSYILGLGEALRLTAAGDGRLATLSREFDQQRRRWRQLDPDASGVQAIAFTGFAFDQDDPMEAGWQGLPNAAVFFPELTIRQQGESCTLSFTLHDRDLPSTLQRWRGLLNGLLDALNRATDPQGSPTQLSRVASTPPDDEWIRRVSQATEMIRNGELDKVVPCRSIRVQAQRSLSPACLMSTLSCLYPGSMLFAISLGGRTFASATPERLAAKKSDRLACDAIGGTTHRAPEEALDRCLGEQLLQDAKSLHEHALVVDGIADSLKEVCLPLEVPETPGLLQLRNLQHLWTQIQGTLRQETNLFDIARRLHPTAAVNGHPAASARRWLSDHEAANRGWYTGAAGWMDINGDGELAVLLRCALLDGNSAELFAGAGITSDSRPVDELRETELKFGAMLEALQNA